MSTASGPAPLLSVVVPALDEADQIQATLACLQPLRAVGHEVVVVDGGSTDDTVELARPGCDRVILAGGGRAGQQNAGARAASGQILWFVHADTRVPPDAAAALLAALTRREALWGRFDVRLHPQSLLLTVVARAMNWRSRLSGIATGDQALFVRADTFDRVGGFPEQPLMEDIAISALLRRESRPVCLRQRVQTSSRRWQSGGALRTIALMWYLRAAYFFGASPARLARLYRTR